MPTVIADSFTADHHRCDRLLAATERALADADWPGTTAAVATLCTAMEGHFALEEGVLFPELAEVFRVAANPIEVMVAEHAQMRALFADLEEAAAAQKRGDCRGLLETLHFLVQQHNYKEEGVLYPMADGALPERGAVIAARLPEG
jgi:iron-sulfur cluster repair protein YtfE (RIC family)